VRAKRTRVDVAPRIDYSAAAVASISPISTVGLTSGSL
jgi:hypothetical protein